MSSDHPGLLNGDHILSDLKQMLTGDRNAMQSVVDLFLMVFDKGEAHEIEVKDVIIQNEFLNDRIRALETELSYIRNDYDDLKQQLSVTHDAARSMYLRLEGLGEEANNNLPQQVATSLSKSGVQCNVADLDYVKRLGKYKQGTIRPILIRFMKEGKRNSILYNRTNINKRRVQGDPILWINDDVSDETRHSRKSAREVAVLAKQQGKTNIKIHGDGLIIDNQKYKHEDFDLLPPNLSITKAKSRSEDTGIYFHGEESPYSNFYQSRFIDEVGQVYESVEQAFQHKKAKAHGKLLLADKMMSTRNGIRIKKLSHKIQTNKNWTDNEKELMGKLIHFKFTQNNYLKNTLLKTGTKQLHEATKDTKWGTGAELSSKALQTGDWSGKDLLGQLLEKERDDLRVAFGLLPVSKIPADQLEAETTSIIEESLTPLSEGEEFETEVEVESNFNTQGTSNSRTEEVTPRKSRSVEQQRGNSKSRSGNTSYPRPGVSTSTPKQSSSTQASIHKVTKSPKSRKAPSPPTETPIPDQGATAASQQPLRGNRATRAAVKGMS